MRLEDMSWFQVRDYLAGDDRIIVPVGACEEHAYLSVFTDTRTVYQAATEAAARETIITAPPIPFGFSEMFLRFPGTISLRSDTLNAVLRDVLRSLIEGGFKRILVLSGHGPNVLLGGTIVEAMTGRPNVTVAFGEPYSDAILRQMQEAGAGGGHASAFEDFPFTRVGDVPDREVPPTQAPRFMHPEKARDILGDGVAGGRYRRGDELAQRHFEAMVEHVRALIRGL